MCQSDAWFGHSEGKAISELEMYIWQTSRIICRVFFLSGHYDINIWMTSTHLKCQCPADLSKIVTKIVITKAAWKWKIAHIYLSSDWVYLNIFLSLNWLIIWLSERVWNLSCVKAASFAASQKKQQQKTGIKNLTWKYSPKIKTSEQQCITFSSIHANDIQVSLT